MIILNKLGTFTQIKERRKRRSFYNVAAKFAVKTIKEMGHNKTK